MRSLFLTFLGLCLCCGGCAPKIQAVEDLEAIKSMFLEFRSAVRRHAGAQAVPYISESSLARYQQFQNWALTLDEAGLAQLSVVEQIETHRLKHDFTEAELQSLTSQEIVAALIDHDRLDAPFVVDASLAEPVFQGKKCYIQIYDGAGAVKEKLTFFKEGDHWKIDISALEDVHEKIYRGMIRRKDLSPDELVQSIVDSWDAAEEKTLPTVLEENLTAPLVDES